MSGEHDTLTRPASRLVGREREAAELEGLAEAASSGRGRAVLIEGQAGIGKTRLVRQVFSTCEARGFTTLYGRADQVEQRWPFGVIAEALGLRAAPDPARRRIARLLRAGGPAAAEVGLEIQVSERVTGYLEQAARRRPVVMALEDLQWADPSSLVAVGRLAAVAAGLPLLLVCTQRPVPRGLELARLLASLRRRDVVEMSLGPLSPDAVAELAGDVAGAPPGRSLLDMVSAAAGNPFYVSELIRGLIADGTAAVSSEGLVEAAGRRLPPSLAVTVLRQLDFLSQPTLELLRVGAALGGTFSIADLSLDAPRPVSELARALEPARLAGIVVERRGGFGFRHDLIREAIYQDMPRPVRTALHRRLASRLEEVGAPPERVAAQLMLGAEPGDARAVDALRTAARQTSPVAPAVAVDLLERALELAPRGPGSTVDQRIRADLVRPLVWLGRGARAEAVCRTGLASRAGHDQALFRIGLACALIQQLRFAEADAEIRGLPAEARLGRADRAWLEAAGASTSVFLGEASAGEAVRAVLTSAPATARLARVFAGNAVTAWELFQGNDEQVLREVDNLQALGAPPLPFQQLLRSEAFVDLDRLEEAREVLREGLEESLEFGMASAAPIHHTSLAIVEYFSGRLDAALVRHADGRRVANELGERLPPSSHAVAARIALLRGDAEEAARETSVAREILAGVPEPDEMLVWWASGLVAEATGEAAEAAEAARRALAANLSAGSRAYLAWNAPDLVRLLLAVGDRPGAERIVAAAEQVTGDGRAASWRAAAVRARGLLEQDPERLVRAVELYRQAPRPIDLALAQRDAALGLGAAGRSTEARRLAVESLRGLSDLGAAGTVREARSQLMAVGLRVGVPRRLRRAKLGWDSLTESELAVARLLAQGMSNPRIAARLYVSRHTVESHVSSALRKLSLSSRVQLAAEISRREPERT